MKKLDIHPHAQALIFDLDGTLADTMPIHFIAWRNAAARYGIDFTVELFAQLAGIPLYPTVEKLNEMFGTNIDPQEMGDSKEEEFEANMHHTKPIEPVVELVKKYHGKLPMSIGTGGARRLALKTLEIIGLKDYFQILVCAEDVVKHKPHPDTFLKCAEHMQANASVCQVFEDGILGIRAAQSAGMMITDVRDFYDVRIGHESF